MKYVKNTGRYAIAFVITKNNREVKIELDKRRIYMDTGNIATTGITPVEEDDLKELKKISRFNAMVKKEELTILEESEVRTPEESRIKALEEKNRELEEQLNKAENADVKKVEAEKETLAEENANLKAQLEALTKGNKDKEDKKSDKKSDKNDEVDTEGF